MIPPRWSFAEGRLTVHRGPWGSFSTMLWASPFEMYTVQDKGLFLFPGLVNQAGFQTAGPSHIRRTYYFWIANQEDDPVRAWEGLTRSP